MKEEIINSLLSAKHGPFLSILLPMPSTAQNRKQRELILDRARQKSRSILKRTTSKAGFMSDQLDKLMMKFNPSNSSESLGLFVSPEVSELVCFPFPVTERIIVDDSFETRDLHYLRQFMAPYYTLLLTSRFVRLYFAQGSQLDEIHDGIFPMEYKDEYEYARPAFGTSYGFVRKHYEKDKGTITKLRHESFYREAITNLQSYLRNQDMPLVVCGSHSEVSTFSSLNDINESIATKVYGSFTEITLEAAAEKAWMGLKKFRKNQETHLVNEFKEKDTRKRMAKGIQEVWQAAIEGKGKQLLVEKDYKCPSYLRDGDPTLYLRAPKGKYMIVPDAVDEIIETVIEKGGKVLFTADRSLRYFDSIALELRY